MTGSPELSELIEFGGRGRLRQQDCARPKRGRSVMTGSPELSELVEFGGGPPG